MKKFSMIQSSETNHIQPSVQGEEKQVSSKRIRLTVTGWDGSYIYGTSAAHDKPLRIAYTETEAFAELPAMLYPEAQLNALTCRVEEDGTVHAELLVLEPDYLIDISSLAECIQRYGDSPLNYLVQRFKPRENSHHILLGNAANQFLDDCVNEQPEQPASYERSIQKVFRGELLAYSANEHIDADYFKAAKEQFGKIHDTVHALFTSPVFKVEKNGVLLEPSFLCECMGLQGRMDFLQGDFRCLIELKSGKAEGSTHALYPRESHALQMALYKEVLFYNLGMPREEVTSYLFYSKYPKLFVGKSQTLQIQRAMQLRNGIVCGERKLREDGGRSILSALTADTLNTRHANDTLWRNYQRPQIEEVLAPIRSADELTAAYFYTFTAFVAREQYIAKTGCGALSADCGFANTWNTDTATKQAAGNMLTDLTILDFAYNEGIEEVTLSIPPSDEGFLPNFRLGDIVLLYERNGEENTAVNRQVIRGSIGALLPDRLTVHLRYKQRNPIVFHRESRYAIEHDFMDSSFGTLYKGLYSLLTTPARRRDLLLSQRMPERDTSLSLTGSYANEQVNDIVLKAKQARDYFLLVGPPGTGKTSVTLRAMVQEFYANPACNLLLLSYTNRAVDEICEMLESITPTPPYVRIGSELSCEARFRPRLMKNFMQSRTRRSEVCRALGGVRILVGTTTSIGGHPELFTLKHFDVAIVDEASQILEPQIMGLLCAHHEGRCAIDKFILIGDHKQLPAVVVQPTEQSAVKSGLLHEIGITDCRNSLFERLFEWHTAHPQKGICAMLHRQGRMHPAISDFVNRRFYGDQLDIVPVPHQQAPLEWTVYDEEDKLERLVATTRTTFIDTPLPPEDEPDKVNRPEAHAIAQIVATIHRLCHKNGMEFCPSKQIGIIVPFRSQIALVTKELASLHLPDAEQITIDTVERYQGSQRDIIIYGTTISRPYQLDILSVPVTTCGVTIDRKLNVALTRARKQLFILGHTDLLRHQPVYRELLEFMESVRNPVANNLKSPK